MPKKKKLLFWQFVVDKYILLTFVVQINKKVKGNYLLPHELQRFDTFLP